MCSKCQPRETYWWKASLAPRNERIFCEIISELHQQAMPKTTIQRKVVDGILPVKIVENCKACKQALGTAYSTQSIMLDGGPHCYGCGVRVCQRFPVSRRCDCLSILIDFVQCIPENQLHLLTFSKWLKAVGCEQHRDILYELNAASDDGTKTGKLRSFFKIEEIARTLNISETSMDPKPVITVDSAAEIDIQPSTSKLTKLDASILIPENQLCLLTYSKWLNAVGCTKHQDMLYELTAASADGSTTGKLRSFFKKENDDIQKSPSLENMALNSSKPVAQAANEHKKKLETLMSNLDISTSDGLLSARITCSCGSEQELSNMFDCFTCSTYGVCSLCLANKHWGHEMNKSLNTLALCLIDSQSEVARQKLSTWTGHAKELSQQNEKAFEKLSRVLGGVFKEAATKSGDIQRIQTLLTKTSTSDLEPFIRNANSGTKLLNERIDTFCDKLLKAVEEEAQKDKATPQENSPADQK